MRSVVLPDYVSARFDGNWFSIANNNYVPDQWTEGYIYADPYSVYSQFTTDGTWYLEGFSAHTEDYSPADRYAFVWSDLYIDKNKLSPGESLTTIHLFGIDGYVPFTWACSISVVGKYYDDSSGEPTSFAHDLTYFSSGSTQSIAADDLLPQNTYTANSVVYVEEVLVALTRIENEEGWAVDMIRIDPYTSDAFGTPLPDLNVEIVTPDVISWITAGVSSFLACEIAPGITIGGIFMIVLAIPLVVAFLKLFAGG